jgi:hypothetical protein
MGAKVSGFVKDVGKAVAKGAISFVGGKIPYVGPLLANKINEQFAKGGKVVAFADGGIAGPKMAVNTPAQLINLVKKAPEIADKYGLSEQVIKDAVAEAKNGEAVMAKKRGGRAKKSKKAKGDSVMLEHDSAPAFARGGLVPSAF